jgi:hypothetical protein
VIVSINQPAYLPWLGYLHRIAVADLHIVLDDVQFEKNSFVNRNKVRTKDGWCWLTVPLRTKGRFGDLAIGHTEIAVDHRWSKKHLDAFRTNYSRAAFFHAHLPFLKDFYSGGRERLFDLIQPQTKYLLDHFEIRTPVLLSSSIKAGGRKDELVLNLCRAVGATTYLSGPLGRNYLREELFAAAGVEVRYHDFAHPTYEQAYPGFQAGMCAFDLLMNHGPASRPILMNAAQIGAHHESA